MSDHNGNWHAGGSVLHLTTMKHDVSVTGSVPFKTLNKKYPFFHISVESDIGAP